MIGYIYSLQLPNSNDIFYVGATINLKARSSEHKGFLKRELILEILERVEFENRKELHKCESYWIEQCRQWGFKITNRNCNKSFNIKNAKTRQIHLKALPADIAKIIRQEQIRIELFLNIKLTKEHVIYHIIKEWYQLKNGIN